jgi:hypothetical protein
VSADPNIQDLKRQGILLNRFYALTHPSQPNYLAAIAGDYFGLNHDGFVRVPENVSTVVDLLDTQRISWAGYFEDLPGPGFMAIGSDGKTGNGGWDYVRKHNPFISFDSVNMNGTRLMNLLSFDDFQRSLDAKQVPQVVWLSPNMMNDGHNTSLKYATDYVHQFLQPLLSESAFPSGERTLIMLTYDESATYSKPNHITTLLLGSAIPPALKGSQDATFYTHYTMLSTLQNNWKLPHLGRYDASANVLNFVADQTGYSGNTEPANAQSVDNSVSYPGYLNNDPSRILALPSPNLKMGNGPGGQPVLEKVQQTWAVHQDHNTPYSRTNLVFDGDKNLPIYRPPTAVV